MNNNFKIRTIEIKDALATLDIYKPYVQNTGVSFEYEPPTLEEWQTRIKTYTINYPWLVCEYNNQIIGYTYAGSHRSRTAYSWDVETAVYLLDKYHRLGIAKILYESLFALLKLQNYVNVYAIITIPNVKSEEFHQKLGFTEIGIFKKTGYKLGAWHNTRWFQLHLSEHQLNPDIPKPFTEILNTKEVNIILETASLKLNNKAIKILNV